ncbi:MAG: hypothetical protein NXI24_10360 [bacterium]|nr:hypothetical protein [bacterium]
MPPPATVRFTIEFRDITACPADVVVLKHARKFYGADRIVKESLTETGVPEDLMRPADGAHSLIQTRGGIRAPLALYLGTARLGAFQYALIREFVSESLTILSRESPDARHVAMTLHGVGAGLDETECALSQLKGLVQAIKANRIPRGLERFTICEYNRKRALRIQERVAQYLKHANFAQTGSGEWGFDLARQDTSRREWAARIQKAGSVPAAARETAAFPESQDADEKPYAFVAMPFREELDDIFFYGIQEPVHRSGLLCERVDQSAFTGDVLEHIRTRIENAKVVIAELSDASPNVYLEVGYAWGRGVPTILLTQSGEALKFDVRNQRCLVYKRIKDLEVILARELEALRESGRI